MKNEVIIPRVLEWAKDPAEIDRLARAKEQIYRDLVDRDGISPIPGVVEWLVMLKAAGIPCAIGSSTHRLNIDCVLRHINLADYFTAIVAGNDVKHGKPAPDIFLKAAERLGYSPDRCVVFEDAHVGIEAARAGGMKVVAVTTTHPEDSLQVADVVVDRLDALTVSGVAALLLAAP
jgi:HAD superfamily hydrolase (TIGR01509 family)